MAYHTNPCLKCAMLATTALALVSSGTAFAADETQSGGGVGIIIVEAQKRAQNVQDVPIAVTALGAEELQSNRVVSVTDLTGLAPGLTVSESAGGAKIPFFIMRGANSAGLVVGSDKQVSLYLDGVYMAATRGSIFDLPDVSRIEVLRGPQGTLFGRNATAGAVSIYTRDPTGEAGAKIQGTVGNYGHYRISASIDFPQMGPLSGYVSYVRNYKRGDIRNVAAGQIWDRRGSLEPRFAKREASPKYLGTTDTNSVFAALKFESGDFTTVYKFDWNTDTGSPRGTALIGYDPNFPGLGPLLDALITTQPDPVPIAADGKRPKTVSNGFVIPIDQEIQGHSLTSTYQFSDSLSVKNIFNYRQSYQAGPSSIDGVASLIITPQAIPPFAQLVAGSALAAQGITPATDPDYLTKFYAAYGVAVQQLTPLIGSPYVPVGSASTSRSEQYGDELQFNYESDFLTATVGAVWFVGKDWANQSYFSNNIFFSPVFGGVIPNTNIGAFAVKAESIAAYTQLEFHLTPQLDIIGGVRVTRDKKTGTFIYGDTLATLQPPQRFSYKKTKPTYLIGVNWKPNNDILVYAKFSTGFVSGGSVGGIPFAPETVTSWEGGVKAEMLNRKLRVNLAVYQASYKHVQGPSAPTSPEAAELVDRVTGNPLIKKYIGTFVADIGNVKAAGFELEVTAAPVTGVTVGGALSYTDTKYSYINPLQIPSSGILPVLNNRPKWKGSVFAQYDSPPIGMGDAYISVRGDAFYQDSYILTPAANTPAYAGGFAAVTKATPSYWLINGRISLKEVPVGPSNVEIGVWGKNLTDRKSLGFGLNLSGILASGNYIPARTYGLDVIVTF